jgi:hypothetical protein
MAKNAVHEMPAPTTDPTTAQHRTWRDEKIFIYFSPRGTDQFAGRAVPGDWVVAEPRKPVSMGQEVRWQALGDCRRLELDLPDIFEEPRQVVVNGQSASATLKKGVVPGLYLYEAYVNGQLATGGSAPGLIVDP